METVLDLKVLSSSLLLSSSSSSRELTCGDIEPKHDKDACCIPIVSNMYSTQVPGARDAIEKQPSQTRGDEVEAIEVVEGCYGGVQVKGK